MLSRAATGKREGQRRRWRGIREVLFLLLLYGALRALLQQDLASGPAPPLQGTLLDGRVFDLGRDARQPVLIHFWATWCRICRWEQEAIEAIARDWPVITVAVHSGSVATVAAHLRRADLSFEVINDPEGRLAQRFGVAVVPVAFIVDGCRRIVFRERGYTTEWGLRLRLWLARWRNPFDGGARACGAQGASRSRMAASLSPAGP